MSDAKKYYCFCSSNCKYETMTKEQILAAIMQAAESGEIHDVDAGFITKVKENNAGGYVTFWTGTQAQFNALPRIETNCLYIFTDSTATDDIMAAIAAANEKAEAALAAAASPSAVDISNKIDLTVGTKPAGVTSLQILTAKSSYIPKAGIVVFNYTLMLEGTLAKGDVISITHGGGYVPAVGMSPAVCSGYACDADYIKVVYGACRLDVTAKEAVSSGEYAKSVIISGWYFCNGEV